MLLRDDTQTRGSRMDIADNITNVALGVVEAFPFGNVVTPIHTATAILFKRIRANNRHDIVMNAIDEFIPRFSKIPAPEAPVSGDDDTLAKDDWG